MQVEFNPEVQAKLEQMAREAGREPAEVIEDAVVGLYDESGLHAGDTRPALRRDGKWQGAGH